MGSILCVENHLSERQFPRTAAEVTAGTKRVSAEEEPSGHEAFRVANGRRSRSDYATASTANSDWYVWGKNNRLRAYDFWALDRGHNLAGYPVELRASCDGFTTYWTIATLTIPTAPGGRIDVAPGVLTEEGAWLYRHPMEASMETRLFVPAMGAGLLPVVVGLWVGLAFDLPTPRMDMAEPQPRQDELLLQLAESDLGYRGGLPVRRGVGVIPLRYTDAWDVDQAEYHVDEFMNGRPVWWVADTDRPDRAILVTRQPGVMQLTRTERWLDGGEADLAYVEHEPRLP